MPEGLSAAEVGKEIAEHKKHAEHGEDGEHEHADRHERWLSIVEAVLLSAVALLAAYSGFAAAKWSTESSVSLAKASALRTKANRADLEALVTRTLDSVSFNAWFTAFVAGNKRAEALAKARLRPGYRPAFNAWLATDPGAQPECSAGPVIHAAVRDSPDRPKRTRSTLRQTPSSREGRMRAARRTSTCATPCSWPRSCS